MMMIMMKKTIEVTTKQLKTFAFPLDLTKFLPEQIDIQVNKFLNTIDGDEIDVHVFPTENFLIISVIYDLED